MDQANQSYRQLRHLQGTKLLTANDRVLPTGILVMPIYLAKGLEFDAVIAYDASKNNYPNAHTAGILYTISSRAMHELTLISLGSLSPIVANHRSLISEQ
jgi:DNA helicase IV